MSAQVLSIADLERAHEVQATHHRDDSLYMVDDQVWFLDDWGDWQLCRYPSDVKGWLQELTQIDFAALTNQPDDCSCDELGSECPACEIDES